LILIRTPLMYHSFIVIIIIFIVMLKAGGNTVDPVVAFIRLGTFAELIF